MAYGLPVSGPWASKHRGGFLLCGRLSALKPEMTCAIAHGGSTPQSSANIFFSGVWCSGNIRVLGTRDRDSISRTPTILFGAIIIP